MAVYTIAGCSQLLPKPYWDYTYYSVYSKAKAVYCNCKTVFEILFWEKWKLFIIVQTHTIYFVSEIKLLDEANPSLKAKVHKLH